MFSNYSIASDMQASEIWEKDCKLFMPFNEQILLYESANCISVQTFLKMCQFNFEIEHRTNAEHMSPSGEVPFIKCGAIVVSELLPIVNFVEKKGYSLTQKLRPELTSTMAAYIDMVNNVLLSAEMFTCWHDEYTLEHITYPQYTFPYPWPLNKILFNLKKRAINRKLSRFYSDKDTMESVLEKVEECLQKLTELLEDEPFLLGKKPTELDALVFGHLAAILGSQFSYRRLAEVVHRNLRLMSYYNQIIEIYFKREAVPLS